MMPDGAIPAIVAVAGIIIGYIVCNILNRKSGKAANVLADNLKKEADREATRILKEAEVAAKDERIKIREEFEKSTKETRLELSRSENQLKDREVDIDRKMDLMQMRGETVDKRELTCLDHEKKVQRKSATLDEMIKKEVIQLEAIGATTRDQARVQLMQRLEKELIIERATMIRRYSEEVKRTCDEESQKLLIQAMQRYAGECAYNRTTATIPLPSDEMKGRIIGREGRNIRVFEAATGVNVLIDDTPAAVVITCFDPVRREVARLSLERLVEDGRIHPTRVEEVVEKAREDINKEIIKAGEDALHAAKVADVEHQVVEVLGRLRFRYSYSQNVLQHSIEVAALMAMIAAELDLDVEKAKRMGLFHDIGKALDHDIEGSHALIGMEFLKRANEDKDVLNGVGCHHDEIPAESSLASLVSVCDALSASRPGARSETTEFYIKRLEQLEEIGNSYEGVDACYAVQAGREIRVIVEPEKVNELEATVMSRDLAQRIESEMQYPGQIKVCVVRETRAVEYAK
jgi:ribonuclease Y